ncbi:MAG: hypothetical protein HC862_29945 [Scytonema sp. RU_4_4]|nr:hypothetical protein [Scytonema sp. RU_4_4]
MEINKSTSDSDYKFFKNDLLDNIDKTFNSEFNYFSPAWNEILTKELRSQEPEVRMNSVRRSVVRSGGASPYGV